jgi:lactate dehydrogenase-like 2-hydroxyacid dehydrogenase
LKPEIFKEAYQMVLKNMLVLIDALPQAADRLGRQEDNPLLALKQDNLIVTPHVAWVSEQSMQSLAEQLIGNIESFVSGAPRNLV